jgi:hypothetical protein
MSAIVGGRRQSFERSSAAILATLAAGLLTGSALAAAGSFEVRYVWAGVGAAVPVALTLAVVATVRPRQAALGLTGLLVFAGAAGRGRGARRREHRDCGPTGPSRRHPGGSRPGLRERRVHL